MTTRLVFMGTPDFAVPTLKALLAGSDPRGAWHVVGVVTQPDRPRGRGKKLAPPPVKEVALAADVSVLQPKSLKAEAAVAELAALEPEVIVVAAFGQILRPNVLDMPAHGCLNVHASLLPRWRGAAPVHAAIRAGDDQTGVTIMKMDVGLDTGPMLAKKAIPIRPGHNVGALTDDLAHLGAELLVETLPAWLAGEIAPEPQDDDLATFAPRIEKEEGRLDWTQPAEEIARLVRAFDPWPSTFTTSEIGRLKIINVAVAEAVSPPTDSDPGLLFERDGALYVVTGDGVLEILTLQPAGKRAMSASDLLNGQPDLPGTYLGAAE